MLAADRLADLGGTLAELLGRHRSPRSTRLLPPTWSHGNPVDIIGDADPGRYAARARRLLDEPGDADAILVMNCPTALASSTDVARGGDRCHGDAPPPAGKPSKPVLTNWLGDEAAATAASCSPSERHRQLRHAGGGDRRLHAARALRARAGRADAHAAVAARRPGRSTPPRPRAVIAAALQRGRTMLSEVEAKALLAAYGIPVVPTAYRRNPDEVARDRRAHSLERDKACVVKILSDDISHKSDVGGVRLGLERRGGGARGRGGDARARRARPARRHASRASRCSR